MGSTETSVESYRSYVTVISTFSILYQPTVLNEQAVTGP